MEHVRRQPLWAVIATPGLLNEPVPEVREARSALAASKPAADAVEAFLVRRAMQKAAAAAAAPNESDRVRLLAHYECLCELLATLNIEPARPQPPRL